MTCFVENLLIILNTYIDTLWQQRKYVFNIGRESMEYVGAWCNARTGGTGASYGPGGDKTQSKKQWRHVCP